MLAKWYTNLYLSMNLDTSHSEHESKGVLDDYTT